MGVSCDYIALANQIKQQHMDSILIKVIFSLFQIQEYLPFQEEDIYTHEPLLADVCMFCFNNMETFRSEVKKISKLRCMRQ